MIIGGGIAGYTCAQHLSKLGIAPIHLISETPLLKAVGAVTRVTKLAEELTLAKISYEDVKLPNVTVSFAAAVKVDYEARIVTFDAPGSVASGKPSGGTVQYSKLCLCTGARPRLAVQSAGVIGIRDTSSVEAVTAAIEAGAKRIVVVGNGGIAMEVANAVAGPEVVWAVREDHCGNAFFDARAAAFLVPDLTASEDASQFLAQQATAVRAGEVSARGEGGNPHGKDCEDAQGGRAGSDDRSVVAAFSLGACQRSRVRMLFQAELRSVLEVPASARTADKPFPLVCAFQDGRTEEADLVISATGVIPNTELAPAHATRAADGGLVVDREMRTSVANLYAAGDCCSIAWSESAEWFQMRLWSQAKMEGAYAAHCIASDLTAGRLGADRHLGFNFDIFAHATRFFGFPCIFLGRFNGQGLGDQVTEMVRCTPGKEFVKFVLFDGRLVGAVLIGDTDLEETAENLIMNGIDLTPFGHDLLDPANDIEDYFD